ncbi:hypothetical protein [Dactylosporangium sp. NPDC049140]|uniref:hypothetical protein n=1 Tax=Dactylosporangium sp. NPDC049140 TaxID=3155647 RepID=UPI0034033712
MSEAGAARPRQSVHADGASLVSALDQGNQFNIHVNLPSLADVVENIGSVLGGMMDQADRAQRRLEQRVADLDRQLRAAAARCVELEARMQAGQERRTELEAELRLARQEAEQRVARLQAELAAARAELDHAAAAGSALRTEEARLADIEHQLEGRALAQFERAGVLERELARLRPENAMLRELIGRYQATPGA